MVNHVGPYKYRMRAHNESPGRTTKNVKLILINARPAKNTVVSPNATIIGHSMHNLESVRSRVASYIYVSVR